jgi:ubiquinol-cytochrome c reductase cytochrome b subunit
MNVVAIFFICVYIHIGKAIYYGSYKLRESLCSRCHNILYDDGSGFLGYVLPFGQMSYYGAL